MKLSSYCTEDHRPLFNDHPLPVGAVWDVCEIGDPMSRIAGVMVVAPTRLEAIEAAWISPLRSVDVNAIAVIDCCLLGRYHRQMDEAYERLKRHWAEGSDPKRPASAHNLFLASCVDAMSTLAYPELVPFDPVSWCGLEISL